VIEARNTNLASARTVRAGFTNGTRIVNPAFTGAVHNGHVPQRLVGVFKEAEIWQKPRQR
jgi:hypothetical protein